MKKGFHLPPGITAEAIVEASKMKDPAWRKALLLALKGTGTAKDIAREAGLSRSALFQKRRELYEADGLRRSFQTRTHGRKTKIVGNIRDELASKFSSGKSIHEIQDWLASPSIGISIGRDGVYYWRRKLGFGKKRIVRTVRKLPPRGREDPLECRMDAQTRNHLVSLLEQGVFTTDSRIFRGRRKLEALLELTTRTLEKDKGKRISGRKVASDLGCSPKLLYEVAALFKDADSDWNAFVERAYSEATQKDWDLKISV